MHNSFPPKLSTANEKRVQTQPSERDSSSTRPKHLKASLRSFDAVVPVQELSLNGAHHRRRHHEAEDGVVPSNESPAEYAAQEFRFGDQDTLTEELGLDHFKSALGTAEYHHELMPLICFAFLQRETLHENMPAA